MEKYKSNLAFIDILFQFLTALSVLLWLAVLLINDPGKKEVDTIADMLITVNWPNSIGNDIDIWVMDPIGNMVGYKGVNRDAGFMSLERDDLGDSNDTLDVGGLKFRVNENSEVVPIRKMIPGEYHVSIHYYSNKVSTLITPVTVKLIKVNPIFKIVYIKKALVENVNDESAFFRFTIDDKGKVLRVEEDPPAHFVIGPIHSAGQRVFSKNLLEVKTDPVPSYENGESGGRGRGF